MAEAIYDYTAAGKAARAARLANQPVQNQSNYQTNPSEVTGATGFAGSGQITRPAYEQQQQTTLESQLASKNLQERAALNDAAFSKRLASLSTSGGTMAPHVNSGGIAGNEEAARTAAFARAKDIAGKTALSSLTALQNVMNNRGMTGSTEDARLTQAGLLGGQDVINEYTRDQLGMDLNRAADIGDRVYAGNITQRGQDMSAKNSLLALINSAGAIY